MPKAFTVASWNVEHFKDDPGRVAAVVAFLAAQAPLDVFALYEVEGKAIYNQLLDRMPKYQFHITEGPQTQEILVGVRPGLSAFFTQKVEFKSGNPMLRPGALLTVRVEARDYSLLFLHTKSAPTPVGLGLRDDMIGRAFDFKRHLDKIAKKAGLPAANFLFLGDLNTMGMEYPFDRAIAPAVELRKLDREAAKAGMRRLEKNRPHTWWNGPRGRLPPSDLDHVVAARQLEFRAFAGAPVDVRGWPRLPPAEQQQWIDSHSDHALLYFEVQKLP